MNAIAARFTIAVGRRTGDRAIGHRLINRQSPGTPRSAAAAVVVMCVVIVLGSSAATLACKVPVFRYALERWEPAPYRVVVLTADAAAAESLALPALAGRPGRDRRLAEVRVVDAARPLEEPLAAAWAAHGGPDTPVVVVRYPNQAGVRGRVAHAGPLGDDRGAVLASSPARDAVARQLAAGCSAVWILVESGDAAADAAARRVIEAQAAHDRKAIRLPDAAALEIDPALLGDVRIPLGIEFGLVTVARDDPREAFLVDSLLGSEDDLRDFDAPLAFPVFGRGVVLYALVGPGITADNVAAAHAFITGDCSCVVKEQNPGFDLLLGFDWDAAVGDVLISQPPPGKGSGPQLVPIPAGSR